MPAQLSQTTHSSSTGRIQPAQAQGVRVHCAYARGGALSFL